MIDIESLERGWFPYKRINGQGGYFTVMQHPDVGEVFDTMFNQIRPSTVIEIGSALGGFTILVRDLLDKNGLSDTKLVTWDVSEHGKNMYKNQNLLDVIDSRVENIFDHWGGLWEQYVDEVTQLIQREGTTVVLCDGGTKLNELRALSPLLKKDDIIMGHDYHADKVKYNSMSKEEKVGNNIWPFCETWDEKLDVPSDFAPFMHGDFERVGWLCLRRNGNG